ncbi:type IV pilus assembly protein PilC [Mobilisporobacter senegalensis]|uniref:Type IV pilus assembly protein PilC n=1 Tax=Mobilisporobacter senegalensis TaxID=1329262 RepID=A0A3N1XVI8_9FIRM|nr:type II secretion system F family protein [Mobilisporobacter senegalensis]ROR30635.1 type IV pilus assembly protein PilC [Mobilisporobacter senegalensis]
MADFSYVIIDKNGKEKKGSMDAANEEKVKASLRAEGYIPLSVTPQNIMNKDINLTFGSSVKPRDLSVFCRQLVSILSAGVSIINALDMLSQQTENQVLSKAIKEVQIAVEKGEALADAMEANKKVFPNILIHMVAAGEASGNLEVVFGRMAVHFEKDTKMRAQVKKAMIYPSMVALVAVGVVFVMMIVVIPNFMGMFQDMNIEMPFMTQMIINMSNFMKSQWYMILGLIILIAIGFHAYKKSPSGQMVLGQLGLKLPLFGKIIIKSNSARFGRTLSTLLAAGISMIEAIDITARTMDNVIARQALLDAKEDVSKGISLSVPIRNSGIFPPMVYQMTRIGEESGNIESMLEKLADYYDEEVEIATTSLSAVLEPMIIVIMALVVGVLIMAIMQPMLSMYNGLDSL